MYPKDREASMNLNLASSWTPKSVCINYKKSRSIMNKRSWIIDTLIKIGEHAISKTMKLWLDICFKPT